MEIRELYDEQARRWREHNQKLFGLTATSYEASDADVLRQLKKDEKKYWREGACDFKEELLSNEKRIAQRDLLFADTFALTYNPKTNVIILTAQFLTSAELEGKQLPKTQLVELAECLRQLKRGEKPKNTKWADAQVELTRAEIAYLPLVTELGYRLRKHDYTLRSQAVPLRKTEFSKHDFRSFAYKYFSAVRGLALNGNKSANIEKGRVINIASRLKSQNRFAPTGTVPLTANLILTTTPIEALEISRQVVYANDNARAFGFTGLAAAARATVDGAEKTTGGGSPKPNLDTPFDALKTKDSINAGRVRQLLDIFSVDDDNIIKTKVKNKTYTHYELDQLPPGLENVSCLSQAPFNFFNAPKRLMMANKMRAQALPVKGEADSLTHEIPARVVFGDFDGFSIGDSFVISESFAKKLKTAIRQRFELVGATNQLEEGESIKPEELACLTGQPRYSAWRNIFVEEVSPDFFVVSAEVPFGVGDKLTNLHGSKGVVSLILPDNEMPQLLNNLSPRMKAGAVDIIVPGLSVFERKTFAQVFEGIARALNLTPDEAALEKSETKIKEFDESSRFTFQGKAFSAPCGIVHFLRLNHDAASKQVVSSLENHNQSRLGYMELNNLASRGFEDLLPEMEARSIEKTNNAYSANRHLLQEGEALNTPELDVERINSYLEILGFRQTNEIKSHLVNPQFAPLLELLEANHEN